MTRRTIAFDSNSTTWRPSGYKGRMGIRNITYYIPSISLGDMLRSCISILILTICGAIIYGSYLLGTVIEYKVQERKQFDQEIDEVLVPVKAEVEILQIKVQELEAHKSFIYYKYPTKRLTGRKTSRR